MERMQTNMTKKNDSNALHNRTRRTMPYLRNHRPRHDGHWPNQKLIANQELRLTNLESGTKACESETNTYDKERNSRTKTCESGISPNQKLKIANPNLPRIKN